jgi:dihydropteroate synthase
MGIVNLTPDSFYPGSRHPDSAEAVTAALQMIAEGAEILDLGAESTRPGAESVGAAEEQRRLLPVLEQLRPQTEIPVTIDTFRASSAEATLAAGADGINDVSAGGLDPELLPVVAERRCGLVLMHMLGTPKTMQEDPRYDDVVATIAAYLASRSEAAEAAGVPATHIMVDPGIGFGKLLPHNLDLMTNLSRIAGGRPLLLGPSRKSFIAHLTGAEVQNRLGGSLAALTAAYLGGATAVRVHDVEASVQFLDTLAALHQAALA